MVQLLLPMVGSIWHNVSMQQKSTILERRSYSEGDIICKQGEAATTAYLIQMGSIRVFSEKEGKKIELAILDIGEIFGESALVGDPGLRTASIEAIGEVNLIIIRKDVFQKKLELSDPTIRAVMNMLIQRMIRSNTAIIDHSNVSLEQFIASLNQTFENILNAMPKDNQDAFKEDTFPLMKKIISVMEKHRKSLKKRK